MGVQSWAYAAGLMALRVINTAAQTTETVPEPPTAITGCHLHGETQFCMDGDTEYEVILPASATVTAVPDSYDDCHSHGTELFCVDAQGNDVEIREAGAEEADAQDESEGEAEAEDEAEDSGISCHFHAGVEHCVDSQGVTVESTCEFTDREYDIPLRVGFLFIILATSAIGVFGPIFLHRVLPKRMHSVFTVLKQFGTGVIISTAFIHLYTHASLMFANDCLGGRIKYESTTSAILMAGLFVSFLIEYIGHRIVLRKAARESGMDGMKERVEMVHIMVMEAGVIFHSLLIGLTLIVAGDSFFKTLFVVILFHQMFEGIALGSRIAALGTSAALPITHHHGNNKDPGANISASASGKTSAEHQDREQHTPSIKSSVMESTVPLRKKLILALAFALITPIGMAIGIGVLDQYNGNDPSTVIAFGTLDAFSAGILVWVGVVEMWATDWMVPGGELTEAKPLLTAVCLVALTGGMALMSLLGKWA